jgi:protein-tyrosine phosphatase/1-acyl-sn-glycerol-3-phosphate acyltransferase/membrane-associated phospholipid phosphatase
MTRLAARRSALLSLLFLGVYTGCTWLAAQQTAVGEWYFGWERHIPFWPIMIVPYLSIDAFFLAAPFLCRDREELRVYSSRVTIAILAAGACFAWMPLRFAFERPPGHGWAGALLQAFVSIDRPFNLFPSLHVTLGVILAGIYLRRATGALRLVCALWFVLIGVSTLFTYQHHVVDVAGGLALAALVSYAVRERAARQPASQDLRLAGYYLLGAATTAGVAVAWWPLGAALLWPTLSLALVGGAYAGAGPAIFRKSNGTIPFAARVVLGPCLAGQWVSLAHYRRQCRAYDEIAPRVLIGRRLTDEEATAAIERGVVAVLDLSAELPESRVFTRIAYRNIPVVDLTAPTVKQIEDAVRFIVRHAREGVVYVHCKVGYSRSAAVAGAYLLAAGVARTTDEAIAIVRCARPSIVVRPEAFAALRAFETTLRDGSVRQIRQPTHAAIASTILAAAARAICGAARWEGCQPSGRQRIYFANHTSHLDFPAVWASLPPEVRVNARPVAGRDYWDRDAGRRYLSRQVFRAVLVDRPDTNGLDREAVVAVARRSVERAARALATGASLIMFPEGTRGDGVEVAPFKSGLYHLCRLRPDVELVPVLLENMHRILPKGEVLPIPVIGSVTFGRPIQLQPGEDKNAFLRRAHRALLEVHQSCRYSPTLLSRAS